MWDLRDNARVTQEQRPTWEAFARAMGEEFLRARTAMGASQERVAHLAGVSTYTYQKFEKGESRPGTPLNPQLRTLVAVCQVLGLSVSELLAGPLPGQDDDA